MGSTVRDMVNNMFTAQELRESINRLRTGCFADEAWDMLMCARGWRGELLRAYADRLGYKPQPGLDGKRRRYAVGPLPGEWRSQEGARNIRARRRAFRLAIPAPSTARGRYIAAGGD